MKECATSSQVMQTGVKEGTRSMIKLGVIETSVKQKAVIKEKARERSGSHYTVTWKTIDANVTGEFLSLMNAAKRVLPLSLRRLCCLRSRLWPNTDHDKVSSSYFGVVGFETIFVFNANTL
ncbi:hypothetical protein OUZ56_033621 [Daphnia magna]|uniref:Uncharacterized protein n=1 Tax=Daphnia magna TaxID=35525 RepID=A0ABQ9ZY27_9CRUS|nr:hypothetical protein OUZ56_033621 [Daphnia magna]